jgi:hypothetical protein
MPALSDLLEKEEYPLRVPMLHYWLFGNIHPYPDGNGRFPISASLPFLVPRPIKAWANFGNPVLQSIARPDRHM